jgi:serine/threonine protein kinase
MTENVVPKLRPTIPPIIPLKPKDMTKNVPVLSIHGPAVMPKVITRRSKTSSVKVKNFNKTKITVGAKIGQGGYGKIHRCKDADGCVLAAKCIATSADGAGLPSLMESSIMSVINHPHINRALHIHANSSTLYLFQELAISDLSQYIQKNRCDFQTIKRWIHNILQAVYCLHKQDIIHGDIKASNILVYSDGNVKLSDFTLSSRMDWIRDNNRYYNCCTSTHRPLEVWLGKKWGLSVDIWALGCTLFEIIYSRSLFPYQPVLEHEVFCTLDKRARDNLFKDRAVNTLLDWGKQQKMEVPIPLRPVDFISAVLPEEFHNPQYRELNALILSMLRLNPEDRPSIGDLVNDPYFSDLTILPYMIISTPASSLDEEETKQILQKYDCIYKEIKTDPVAHVIKLAMQLYCRCLGLTELTKEHKIYGSLWIAHKMVLRVTPPYRIQLSLIQQIERIMCTHLSFRLHAPVNHSIQINHINSET